MQANSTEAKIRAIYDPNDINEIEGAWNDLLGRCSNNPFLLSGFVKQYMTLYCSDGCTPLVLLVLAHNSVVGISPLRIKRRLGIQFIEFLPKMPFSPDFISDDRYLEICVAKTFDYIFKTLKCQFATLALPAESASIQVIKKLCHNNRIHFSIWPEMSHGIVFVESTWDEFRKLRGKKFRKQLKYLEKKLCQAGVWRIAYVEDGNDWSETIGKILQIEKMSWKEEYRARRGIEIDPDLTMIFEGFQNMTNTEPDLKWSVFFLELNNRTIAYALVIIYKETAFMVKTSYDKRYKKIFPGKYVNNAAIQELFKEKKSQKN